MLQFHSLFVTNISLWCTKKYEQSGHGFSSFSDKTRVKITVYSVLLLYDNSGFTSQNFWYLRFIMFPRLSGRNTVLFFNRDALIVLPVNTQRSRWLYASFTAVNNPPTEHWREKGTCRDALVFTWAFYWNLLNFVFPSGDYLMIFFSSVYSIYISSEDKYFSFFYLSCFGFNSICRKYKVNMHILLKN